MVTSTERSTRVIGIAPQFLVDDLDRAIAYYRDQLGFEVEFVYEGFYASVRRDGIAIHLKESPKLAALREFTKQNEHLDAHISVSGVRELFAEIEKRGARIIKTLDEQPWSCVDFYVEDPDGYVVCFSELIGRDQTP